MTELQATYPRPADIHPDGMAVQAWDNLSLGQVPGKNWLLDYVVLEDVGQFVCVTFQSVYYICWQFGESSINRA